MKNLFVIYSSLIFQFVNKYLFRVNLRLVKILSFEDLMRYSSQNELSYVENEIRLFSNMSARINDLKGYEIFLKRFITNLPTSYSKSKFIISRGVGKSNVNVYREIIHDNGFVTFEKVYYNSSQDLERTLYFHTAIAGRLKEYIETVQLYNVCQGNIISSLYFDYVKIDSDRCVSFNDIANTLFRLQEISLEEKNRKFIYSENGDLFSYRNHFEFKRKFLKICERYGGTKVDNELRFQHYFMIVDGSPLLFGHGDIHRDNLVNKNCLIDWDSFGYFPIGFDFAFSYFKTHDILEEATTLLESSFTYKGKFDSELNFRKFQHNFLFFYFVFTFSEGSRVDERLMGYFVELDKLGKVIQSSEQC